MVGGGRERDWGWAEGGGGGAKSWASSIRQSSSSGMGAGTKDQSCVWLWGVQAKTQSATCLGGRGVAITCSKEMHYQDYCRDDAQEQVAVRLRIMHCLLACRPNMHLLDLSHLLPAITRPLSNFAQNSPKPLTNPFKHSSSQSALQLKVSADALC